MKNNFIEYCLNKKGAIKDYPLGTDPLAIKIAGKIFALFYEEKRYLNLKCDPVIAENLREHHEDVRPGYHMNKKHWNTVKINRDVSDVILKELIDHSYDLVFDSLPKSVKMMLVGK